MPKVRKDDCPHCGRCPQCGRRDEPVRYVPAPWPYHPWWPAVPYEPYRWTWTSNTAGSSSFDTLTYTLTTGDAS